MAVSLERAAREKRVAAQRRFWKVLAAGGLDCADVDGGDVEGERPEGEGGGEDVGVGQGALGEPDGVDGGEEGDDGGGERSRRDCGRDDRRPVEPPRRRGR